MSKKGKLAILVGIDGAGKSTILSALEKEGFVVSHWRKLERIPEADKLNFTSPAEEIQSLKDNRRLRFVMSYIRAECHLLIEPILKQGKDVIADGFFVKFFAKEQIYKRLNLENLLKRNPLTGKELFIVIDVSPKIALQRKKYQKISPYECFNGPDDFIKFQRQLRRNLLSFVDEFSHATLDGELSSQELVEEVKQILIKNGFVQKLDKSL